MNGGEISQLKMCHSGMCHIDDRDGRWCERDGGWVRAHLMTSLLVVVVLLECDVQQQVNVVPKDRVK